MIFSRARASPLGVLAFAISNGLPSAIELDSFPPQTLPPLTIRYPILRGLMPNHAHPSCLESAHGIKLATRQARFHSFAFADHFPPKAHNRPREAKSWTPATPPNRERTSRNYPTFADQICQLWARSGPHPLPPLAVKAAPFMGHVLTQVEQNKQLDQQSKCRKSVAKPIFFVGKHDFRGHFASQNATFWRISAPQRSQ
jgi:hypothetical protein